MDGKRGHNYLCENGEKRREKGKKERRKESEREKNERAVRKKRKERGFKVTGMKPLITCSYPHTMRLIV